jgi:WD40 repeat protein
VGVSDVLVVPLQVRAICWSANDSSIVSAGADGAVYEWRLSDFKRGKENVLKGCQYRWACEDDFGVD